MSEAARKITGMPQRVPPSGDQARTVPIYRKGDLECHQEKEEALTPVAESRDSQFVSCASRRNVKQASLLPLVLLLTDFIRWHSDVEGPGAWAAGTTL